MENLKVVIADDHPMFRGGVRQALEIENNLQIVGEASNGKEALEMILKYKPDVAVLDINMPFLTGLEVVKELRLAKEKIEIVLLTMFDDEEILNEAMDLDVKAYILKECAALDIVHAVRLAHNGRNYVSPSLISKLNDKKKTAANLKPCFKELSEKEIKMLKLIAESKSTKEIAEELYLSPKTVENYRYKICEKLKLSGSYSLLKFAYENKHAL
ncbi:MAG: DNA-binding response regulator [Ignavibacteriae bacterium HGW-Ignavibacteriae-3]|nr:MAG: DNA-binding response regulator [Ignavibacteriae bacterium HGW-Ignavibacteriae-3]